MNNELSILNSASSFVNDTDDSVFNDEVEEVTPVATKEIPKPEPKPVKEEVKPTEKKRREWKPDQSLIADMPELNVKPVTYSKDEFKVADDTTLKNITDESAKKDAAIVLESLQLKDIRIQKSAIEDYSTRLDVLERNQGACEQYEDIKKFLGQRGEILAQYDSSFMVAARIKGGFLSMNPALVLCRICDDQLWISTYAKEGFNQAAYRREAAGQALCGV